MADFSIGGPTRWQSTFSIAVVGATDHRDGPGRAGSAKIVMINIINEVFFYVGILIFFLMALGVYSETRRKRCIRCNTLTENLNSICDTCKQRIDYEKAKAQERETQVRKAKIRAEENRRREEERAQKERRQRQGTWSNKQAPDPYEVLQVTRGASREEIRAAYFNMIKRYHPDRLSHLSKELQDIAETKAKEINEAYDTLTSSR